MVVFPISVSPSVPCLKTLAQVNKCLKIALQRAWDCNLANAVSCKVCFLDGIKHGTGKSFINKASKELLKFMCKVILSRNFTQLLSPLVWLGFHHTVRCFSPWNEKVWMWWFPSLNHHPGVYSMLPWKILPSRSSKARGRVVRRIPAEGGNLPKAEPISLACTQLYLQMQVDNPN